MSHRVSRRQPSPYHLKVIGAGKTCAELSAEAIAQPNNAKLAAQVDTVFKCSRARFRARAVCCAETLRTVDLLVYARRSCSSDSSTCP